MTTGPRMVDVELGEAAPAGTQGHAGGPERVRLDFDALSYDVPAPAPASGQPAAPEKRILFDVSGALCPGQLTAIMGPTGAGKSTLMNVLGGRGAAGGGRVSGGQVLLNGRPRVKADKRHVGYVTQEDLFFGNLTVRQTLEFTAELRLPHALGAAEKRARVDRVLGVLGLGKVEHSLVGGFGSPARGLSGGERRRLSIGLELLSNPSLLLCDEPTSGLDSATAHAIVDALAGLARSGRAVAVTIHQPSSSMFHKFDRLLLLAGGRTVYSGPAADAAAYFSRVGHPCPPAYNPADFMLDLVTGEERGAGGAASVAELCDRFRREHGGAGEPAMAMPAMPGADAAADAAPALCAAGSSTASLVRTPSPAAAGAAGAARRRTWAAPWWLQFRVLTQRAFLQSRGDRLRPMFLFQFLSIAVVTGLVWFQQESAEEAVPDRLGLVFFTVMLWSAQGLFDALIALPPEKPLVRRDRAAGAYRLSAYFLSRTLSQVPVEAVFPSMFVVIAYWMGGLHAAAGPFLAFWVAVQLAYLANGAFGVLIACTVADFAQCIVVASTYLLSAVLVAGFLSSRDSIPPWLRWAQYLSPIKYAYVMAAASDMRGLDFACGPAETTAFAQCRAGPEGGGTVSGQELLDEHGLGDVSPGASAAALLACVFGVRYAAYRVLRRDK